MKIIVLGIQHMDILVGISIINDLFIRTVQQTFKINYIIRLKKLNNYYYHLM